MSHECFVLYLKLHMYISWFDTDLDHPDNLINCSLDRCQASLKISYKSIDNILSNVANRQTNQH